MENKVNAQWCERMNYRQYKHSKQALYKTKSETNWEHIRNAENQIKEIGKVETTETGQKLSVSNERST